MYPEKKKRKKEKVEQGKGNWKSLRMGGRGRRWRQGRDDGWEGAASGVK